MRLRGRTQTLACLLMLTLARPAAAQFTFIERLVDRFSDFNVNLIYGSLSPRTHGITAGGPRGTPRSWGIRGIGVEFAFGVGSIKRDVEQADSTATPAEGEEIAYFDLALGYSQLWGIASTDSTQALTGSIRELPNATMYVTFMPEHRFSPYVGVRTGLVQLHQASIYDDTGGGTSVVQYPVTAQTFQLGAVGGVITYVFGLNAFAEFAYQHRYFAGLVYTAKDNVVPARFPRELNVSGFQLALGIQVRVPRD